MPVYPGDTYYFLCPVSGAVNPGDEPVITVISVDTSAAVNADVTAKVMTAIAGTNLYKFLWDIGVGVTPGRYVAIVSYIAGGVTHSSEYLEAIYVGDSRITGLVALDATVAKDATVALAATTAKSTDIQTINPDNSTTIAAIKAKTDRIPTTPTDITHLTAPLAGFASALVQIAQDTLDATVGSWVIDKTQVPYILSIRRPDNSVLASFTLSEDSTQQARQRLP